MQNKRVYKQKPWYDRFSMRTRIIALVVLGGALYAATLIALFRPQARMMAAPCHYTGGDWVGYKAADNSFRLLFPCAPKRVNARVATPGSRGTMLKQEFHAKGVDNTNYYLNVLIYPAKTDLTKDAAFHEDFIKGLLAGTQNGKLMSSYTTSTNAGTAVDYQIHDVDNQYYLRGRNILSGNVLYALLATNTTGKFLEGDYAKFVNSFQVQ